MIIMIFLYIFFLNKETGYFYMRINRHNHKSSKTASNPSSHDTVILIISYLINYELLYLILLKHFFKPSQHKPVVHLDSLDSLLTAIF